MAAIDLPKIPQDFPKMVFDCLMRTIGQEISGFVGNAASSYEKQKTQQLQDAIAKNLAGSEFLFFTISRIEQAANTLTLLAHFSDAPVPFVPNLKLALVRAEIRIEPWINLTDIHKPIVSATEKDITSFAIEIDFKNERYQVGIGYSQDDNSATKSKQMLVGILWREPPSFYLFGILGQSDKGGLLIDVMADFPFAIPLGPTGLGLKGIGLLYGERFAPLLPGATPQTVMERMARAEAVEYADWAAAGKSLDTWIAVPDDLRMFGISATIVDMCTSGKLLLLKQSGLAYLSFGPTIVFEGGLHILDLIVAGKVVGAIDLRSKSIFGRLTDNFDLIPNAMSFVASIELSAAFENQNHTYVALGGYNMNGCHLSILDVLHLIGGARFAPVQGTALRASAQVSGEGAICGFGGGYSFAVDLAGEIGWNPVVLGAHIGISGSAWLEALGRKLGLGVGLITDFQVLEPKIFTLDLVFTLTLPWPFDPLHFPIEIFAYKDMRPANPLAPLKFGPSDPLSWFHGPSGNTGKLTGNDTKLWPDSILSIDFQRQAGKSSIVVNPSSGVCDEAHVAVEHNFRDLKVEKRDPSTGRYDLVADVRASWLLTANGDHSETTNRLAIPCNDPLSWLNRFDYAQPGTVQPVDRPRFQTFGAGPSRLYDVLTGSGSAIANFEELDIESPEPFWLIGVPWAVGYDRALLSRNISVGFSTKSSSGKLPLPVGACDLRFLGPLIEPPQVVIRNGTADQPRLVRRIDQWHAEWSILVARTPAQAGLLLIVNTEQRFQLAAIGYLVSQQILSSVPDLSVLRPGLYRLTIHGQSRATFRGTPSNQSPAWDVVQDFQVVPPENLRPYVRYSTLGDERIFGLEYGGWNPNPKGSGFGHYQDHLGQIRARVGYLSQIYRRLWIAQRDTDPPFAVNIGRSNEGTPCGATSSQDWKLATGLPVPIEEELNFNVPAAVGTHRLLVFRSLPNDGTNLEVIDEWTYRVSRYANPAQHLTPGLTALYRIFGPFGSRAVTYVGPPAIPSGFDFDSVHAATLRPGWSLPQFIADFANLQSPQVGLRFLQVLDWCGIFDAGRNAYGEGVMSRPDDTDLCAVFDEGRAPLALLVRTSEPCDWRRIDFTLVVGAFDANGERLTTKLIPSPDGCACLVVGMAEGVPIRLPRTPIAMRVRFKLKASGLPRLTVATDTAREVEEIRTTFTQPFGDAW